MPECHLTKHCFKTDHWKGILKIMYCRHPGYAGECSSWTKDKHSRHEWCSVSNWGLFHASVATWMPCVCCTCPSSYPNIFHHDQSQPTWSLPPNNPDQKHSTDDGTKSTKNLPHCVNAVTTHLCHFASMFAQSRDVYWTCLGILVFTLSPQIGQLVYMSRTMQGFYDLELVIGGSVLSNCVHTY